MSSAKITAIGFENYLSLNGESLFDYMTLPTAINKDTLIGTILMRAGEFEVLYSDPYLMRDMIGLWSRKHTWTFNKWVTAVNIEYDPLNNYDRTEEYTDTHQGSSNGGSNGSNTSNNTRTDNLKEKTENDATTTNSVSAENVSTFSDADMSVLDQDSTTTNTGTVSDNGGGSFNETHNDSDNYTNTHKAHIYGNIGVTTSQQMLQSELDIARFNVYEAIADLFLTEFCILVY